MIYNFNEVPDRRQSESLKWHHYDEDALPLWIADMDFRSPEPVIRALRDRVEHGVFGYPQSVVPDLHNTLGYRLLIVERMERLYGWAIQPEDVVFIPGVVTGLNLACHALTAPGGEVVVQTPIYPPFLTAAGNAGLQRVDAELARCSDGSYAVDWDAFEAAFSSQTRMFLLCSPHNPVGRVFRREELERMAEVCLRRRVVICSDEIHSELIFSGSRHTPTALLDPEVARNTITLIAPSKTFNLAGLECSIAIIQNPELCQRYQGASKGLLAWVNVMGWVAGQAAYREGQEWLDQLLIYLEANRDYLLSRVQRDLSGVSMGKPEGTYLAWLDCRGSIAGPKPAQFFLEKARVALNEGETFGQGGEGFVRLNFGCPRPTLAEALDRMQAALKQ